MLTKIFATINPLDAFLACIFFWIQYAGLKRGALVELFKLLSTLIATFVALHYYTRVAGIFYTKIAISRAANDILAFALLWIVVGIIFKLLREGVILFQGKKGDGLPAPVGLTFAVAFVRGILVCSLISFAFLIIENKPLAMTSIKSKIIPALAKLPINIYQKTYSGIFSKFFPKEELNESVLFFTTVPQVN